MDGNISNIVSWVFPLWRMRRNRIEEDQMAFKPSRGDQVTSRLLSSVFRHRVGGGGSFSGSECEVTLFEVQCCVE